CSSHRHCPPPDRPSFPTRRSSDLADVQALVRTAGRAPQGVTSVPGSLEDPDALRRTFRGCDVVFHLAGAVDFRNGETVERVNVRSEEHTSELQSLTNIVCRLLLEK